ncbi:MAG: exosortase K [Candidatus Gastranaerophilales bacterium]|nr:exosortase K [Candidatus Gastranaerophilales bacterium]
MNFRHIKKILTQYFVFYLIGFLIVLGIKYFYSKAGSDELLWILAPTSSLVGALSGIPFTRTAGVGYVNRELRFIIAPSCSGVQFMAICIATLIFSFIHRMGAANRENASIKRNKLPAQTLKRCAGWTAASVICSYLLTIGVNSLRIILAIYLPDLFRKLQLFNDFLTPETLHTAIGTAVYFTSLLTIYRLADRISLKIAFPNRKGETLRRELWRQFLPPVFWYFFLVLGIPFLNGASQKNGNGFQSYALLIFLVCTAVLILAHLAGALLRKKGDGRNLSN